MDSTELHYVTYDRDAIWQKMLAAYADAGGDLLYPGDEKEMLLRAVLAVLMHTFAGVDNAMRMQTLRYAVGDYLDIIGEQRSCPRIAAAAATAVAQFSLAATGETGTLPQGTEMTADGQLFFKTTEDIALTGYAQKLTCPIECTQVGTAGNALLSGTPLFLAAPVAAVLTIITTQDAAGGTGKEDDETYRARIRDYGLASVSTGPQRQYEAAAMAVSTEILDAAALNLGAGHVGVYLILASQTGQQALLDSVKEALNAVDVRPLTDTVSCHLADEMTYTLNVLYKAENGQGQQEAIVEAVTEYQAWQDNVIGQPFNPEKLMALLYQAGASRVVFGEGSAFNDGTVTYTEIPQNARCKGTITLAVMDG